MSILQKLNNYLKKSNNYKSSFWLNRLDDEKYLDTKNQTDPDLIIRTAGNQRISNFLLWQIAYSELYFTKTLWPDFNTSRYSSALRNYVSRKRRFGGD